MGDLLIEIVIWIIRAIAKGPGSATRARQTNRRTVNSAPNTGQAPSSARPAVGARTRPQEATVNQATATPSEQQTAEVWEAYRKKQEALEARFQEKAPK